MLSEASNHIDQLKHEEQGTNNPKQAQNQSQAIKPTQKNHHFSYTKLHFRWFNINMNVYGSKVVLLHGELPSSSQQITAFKHLSTQVLIIFKSNSYHSNIYPFWQVYQKTTTADLRQTKDISLCQSQISYYERIMTVDLEYFRSFHRGEGGSQERAEWLGCQKMLNEVMGILLSQKARSVTISYPWILFDAYLCRKLLRFIMRFQEVQSFQRVQAFQKIIILVRDSKVFGRVKQIFYTQVFKFN